MGAVYSAGLSGKFGALESIISETRRPACQRCGVYTAALLSTRRHHEPGSVKLQQSVVGVSHRVLGQPEVIRGKEGRM